MVPHGFTRGIAHLPIQVRGCSSILWPRSKRKYSWSTFGMFLTQYPCLFDDLKLERQIKIEVSVFGRILALKM